MLETTMPYDLEFLLRAAPHSEAARQAIDVVAQRLKVMSEAQLSVAREQLKGFDPAVAARVEPPIAFDHR